MDSSPISSQQPSSTNERNKKTTKSLLWWASWILALMIVAVLVMTAVAMVRLRVAENMIPKHRWNPSHRIIALETPVIFLGIALFMLTQHMALQHRKEEQRAVRIRFNYLILILGVVVIGALPVYKFLKLAGFAGKAKPKKGEFFPARFSLYALVSLGAACAAKVTNKWIGHPNRRSKLSQNQ